MEFIDLGPVPSWLIIDSVRYAVGRTSSQPDTTARWLCGVWKKLPEDVREIIQRDLEEVFRRDDRARAGGESKYLPLGWDCDRQSWEMVRALWGRESPQRDSIMEEFTDRLQEIMPGWCFYNGFNNSMWIAGPPGKWRVILTKTGALATDCNGNMGAMQATRVGALVVEYRKRTTKGVKR